MLETNALLLLRPLAGQPRVLADAARKSPLGFALWQGDRERRWWMPWRAARLSVHEQEEAPLVFTIRRRGVLWPRHEVRDAEGTRVGSFRGTVIRDRNNLIYALARHHGSDCVYENALGEALAATRHTEEGLELTFMKAVEVDPFAKMLLLAAALLQE